MTNKQYIDTDIVRVIFQPSGRHGEVTAGTTIKEASILLGVDIEGACGSTGTCGKCKVKIAEGWFDKYGIESRRSNLSCQESTSISQSEAEQGYVLACQASITGDIVVFVPEESRLEKQVVRKDAGSIDIDLHPAIKAYCIEMPAASLEDNITDTERLKRALKTDYNINILSIDHTVLYGLQNVIRNGKWIVTVFVRYDSEIIRVVPGDSPCCYGLAVDIGTTTIAGYLCDLTTGNLEATVSMMNPQVVYGEDVMSRISYVMNNENGLETLRHSIVSGLNRLISEACSVVTTSPENIMDMTIAGNTCMHHILLGIHPEYIGKAPFIPAVQNALDIKTRDIGINLSAGSYVYILPVQAGFVGADTVAALLSADIHHRAGTELLIDIGTNGELVLIDGDRMVSCSCATGPAFEGAEIRFGIRAVNGAIERISIDPATGETDFKVIGSTVGSSQGKAPKAKGICGSAIIDLLPQLLLAGIIDKTGRFTDKHPSDRFRIVDEIPEYVIAWAKQTSIGQDITVCQADIRAIQLAKAALYAGSALLMKKLSINKLDTVKLAGAFGNYIDKSSAALLGLFPDCAIDKVISIGNAAGDGARMALLDTGKRKEAEQLSRQVEYLELTKSPDFERMFAEAMWIPHMKDEFPSLETWE